MLTTDRRRKRNPLCNDSGTAVVSFALVAPILIGMTLAVLEFTLVGFEYLRAGEGARYAVRRASMMDPIADMTAVENGGTVTCKGLSAGGVDCGGETVESADTFSAIVGFVQRSVPTAIPTNVEVLYQPSGLGDPDTPAGILPILSVRIVGLEHEFIAIHVLGKFAQTITLPDIEATTVSSSVDSTNI